MSTRISQATKEARKTRRQQAAAIARELWNLNVDFAAFQVDPETFVARKRALVEARRQVQTIG